jgi:hypothetical protein
MLVIRAAQMKAFEDDQLCLWIAQLLRTAYPDDSSAEGTHGNEIVAGLREARRRGLASAYEIRKYVHVAFLTRWTLETAPEYAWARAILDDDERGEPGDRVSQVESLLLAVRSMPADQHAS